jgi:Ca-activated chloride channel family protein
VKLLAVAFLNLIILVTTAQSQQGRKPGADRKSAQPPASAESAGEEIGEDDVLRINTRLVSVPVSVMDRDGRYIFDLRQEDFAIYENGVEQQITHFSSVEQPFSVVLLVDTSSSTESYLGDIKEAANAFLDQLRLSDSVLPITFNGLVRPLTGRATSNLTTLRKAIERMRTDQGNNGTKLYDAVDYAYYSLSRITGRKAIILFTDGDDTWSSATMKDTLSRATELDALIYTIHYGNSSSAAYLGALSEKTGGHFYQADNVTMIKQAFVAVAEELRRQYSIGYYPKASSRHGEERQITVKVKRPHVGVRTRKSYIYLP